MTAIQITTEKKKKFNDMHPELRPGEKFLCNAGEQGIEALKKRWKTLRIGWQAYESDGKKLDAYVPVFVSSSEKVSFRTP